MKTLMTTLNWRESPVAHPKGADGKISEVKTNDFNETKIQNLDVDYQELINNLNGN